MSELGSGSDVLQWVASVEETFGDHPAYGRFEHGIVWIDEPGPDGRPIGGTDPTAMIREINAEGWPLLHGHDPGRPLGRVIAARAFVSEGGQAFAAAIFGFYSADKQIGFAALGVDSGAPVKLPDTLPAPRPEWRIEIAYDDRDAGSDWVRAAAAEAPLPCKVVGASYNSESELLHLVTVCLPYAALVWNPTIKAIGEAAGKDIYAAVRTWVRGMFVRVRDRKRPVICTQVDIRGCQTEFLFRGGDLQLNYEAHDALPGAAVQAGALIANFASRGVPAARVVYEFHLDKRRWYPAYAVLDDGRLVSDENLLIAVERLPSELSLGILSRAERPLPASSRRPLQPVDPE